MQGYTSHNAYDSYIPEDREVGMYGGNVMIQPTKYTDQKNSVINRAPSKIYQINEFDDYQSNIGTGAKYQNQAPSRTYDIQPSPARSIIQQNSVVTRYNPSGYTNTHSQGFHNNLDTEQKNFMIGTQDSKVHTYSNQTFQPLENSMGNIRESKTAAGSRKYLNKGAGRGVRSRVTIIQEEPE